MTTTSLPRRRFVDGVLSSCFGDFTRIAVDGAVLTLTGSDLATTITTSLPCSTASSAETTLPSKLFASTAKALSQDDIELTISTSRLQMRTGSQRAEVAALGRVPMLPSIREDAWVDITAAAAKLASAIRSAATAMCTDASRPTVCGVRVESDRCIATDGCRLHVVDGVAMQQSFTLSPNCVHHFVDAFEAAAVVVSKPAPKTRGKKAAEVVEVSVPPLQPTIRMAIGERNVAVEVTYPQHDLAPFLKRTVVCRREPEPYCEWRRLMRDDVGAAATAQVQRDVVLTQLRNCPADAVTLLFKPTGITVDYVVLDDTSTRRLGSGSVDVEAAVTITAPNCSVKVATRYLVDALKICGDVVELSAAPSSPLRIKSDGFDAIVMFVR